MGVSVYLIAHTGASATDELFERIRRFFVESENRWVRLRVTSAALRLIDKVGIDQIVADLRAKGEL